MALRALDAASSIWRTHWLRGWYVFSSRDINFQRRWIQATGGLAAVGGAAIVSFPALLMIYHLAIRADRCRLVRFNFRGANRTDWFRRGP